MINAAAIYGTVSLLGAMFLPLKPRLEAGAIYSLLPWRKHCPLPQVECLSSGQSIQLLPLSRISTFFVPIYCSLANPRLKWTTAFGFSKLFQASTYKDTEFVLNNYLTYEVLKLKSLKACQKPLHFHQNCYLRPDLTAEIQFPYYLPSPLASPRRCPSSPWIVCTYSSI